MRPANGKKCPSNVRRTMVAEATMVVEGTMAVEVTMLRQRRPFFFPRDPQPIEDFFPMPSEAKH